jgi:hypothetical protein
MAALPDAYVSRADIARQLNRNERALDALGLSWHWTRDHADWQVPSLPEGHSPRLALGPREAACAPRWTSDRPQVELEADSVPADAPWVF